MPDDALRAHLTLALTPGLGPKLTRAVLDHFGTAVGASAAEFERVPGVSGRLAAKFAAGLRAADWRAEWDLMARHRVRVTPRGEPGYPDRLAALDDAPGLLYTRGALAPADAFAVGIVGSRGCTSYGRRAAETIAGDLAAAGFTVVSGLARGIDAAAHTGALRAKGRTVAVLAGGLSRIYPPEHEYLADEIAASGVLVTETPMLMDPQAGMFPARNRIISGLSLAIVVIEANAKSGALITATHAAEQGREVYAVPGNVDSLASAGCLELIRKGARLVRNAADILEDLQGLRAASVALPPPRAKGSTLFDAPVPVRPPETPPRPTPATPPALPPRASPPPPALSPVEQTVWDALTGPKHLDDLTRELGRPVHELHGPLMTLEMSRLIRRLPGNTFERQ